MQILLTKKGRKSKAWNSEVNLFLFPCFSIYTIVWINLIENWLTGCILDPLHTPSHTETQTHAKSRNIENMGTCLCLLDYPIITKLNFASQTMFVLWLLRERRLIASSLGVNNYLLTTFLKTQCHLVKNNRHLNVSGRIQFWQVYLDPTRKSDHRHWFHQCTYQICLAILIGFLQATMLENL